MTRAEKIDFGPRYGFIRELGSGGMGRVFLVRDSYLDRELALKLLHEAPSSAAELEQVHREFLLLSRMEHPGIAKAYDFGQMSGRPYFTSEFIEGRSLGGGCNLKNLGDLFKVALEVTDAVAFLHDHEILHLDIKPSNLLVSPQKQHDRTVLIDFGLCRRHLSEHPGAKLRGSLPYMAPEYFQEGVLGPWTDIYAMGVTFYRLATGQLPRSVSIGDIRAVFKNTAAIKNPSEINPFLPADFDFLIFKCLALDPAARFATAGELLSSLTSLQGRSSARKQLSAASGLTVGRKAEFVILDRLLHSIERRLGGPIAVLVSGAPGMGQSHFLRDGKIRSQMRGFHSYLEMGYPGRPSQPGSLFRFLCIEQRGKQSRWEKFLDHMRRPRRSVKDESTENERRLRRASEIALAIKEIREPTLLIVDGLQFFEEISVSLLIDLIRVLGGYSSQDRPPIGVAAGYREEGPLVPLLRELSETLLERDLGEVISLGPLSIPETLELHDSLRIQVGGGADRGASSGLKLYQETGGCPAKILSISAIHLDESSRHRPFDSRRWKGSDSGAPLNREEFELLLTLQCFQHPVTASALSRALAMPKAQLARLLKKLHSRGLTEETELEDGKSGWKATPSAADQVRSASNSLRRRLHRQIADSLTEKMGSAEDPTMAEAVRHYQRAGMPAAVVKYGLTVARYLKATHQNRAALELFGTVLKAIPRNRRRLHLEVVLEIAELHARIGDLDEGIGLLRQLLTRSRDFPERSYPAARTKILLRLAMLHSRRGDFQRANALFSEGLPKARRLKRGIEKEEFLYFLNEHAAMKAFVGEYAEALKLCDEGLHLAGNRGDFNIREIVLNLYATRANVAMRCFDNDLAIENFEKALEIAEAIGSPVNQSVILNNLGIVYMQCDRYGDAIRSYREAERTCLQRDVGPSLASIYGNLALLHAKRGEFEEMDQALHEGENLLPGAIGQRQRLFLEHTKGLCLVYRGRYREAQASLEKAIQLGVAVGDHHVTSFDEIYRAEALLFQAKYSEASSELNRLASLEGGGRICSMAMSRLAYLMAITSQLESLPAVVERYERKARDRPVPFLDAWDGLFLGWALSIAGSGEEPRKYIDPAADFFQRHELAPALSLIRWIKAEGHLLRGEFRESRELCIRFTGTGNSLTMVLWPLLEARLRRESQRETHLDPDVADLLARAGSGLIGNPLPEWEARLAYLRLPTGSEMGETRRRLLRRRQDISQELAGDLREAYLESRHWKAWAPLIKAVKRRQEKKARKESAETDTVPFDTPSPQAARQSLVARSAPMRELRAVLNRLRDSELPVLIRGETGSGKEFIARLLHAESRRSQEIFQVVDCATIPAGLFEVELFGARVGAFTDLKKNRQGILERAGGGTVFLDKICEVPLEFQMKLLRVISEGTLRPIGSDREQHLNIRFLFATACDLEQEVQEGRFRSDLFHRINVVSLEVPPLRKRIEDLPELVHLILKERIMQAQGAQMDVCELPEIEAGIFECLSRWPWPGNVRELKNLLSRLIIQEPRRLRVETVEKLLEETDTTSLFPDHLLVRDSLQKLQKRLERDYLLYHIHRLNGDSAALCAFFHLSRRQLYRRCDRLGISLREERKKTEE